MTVMPTALQNLQQIKEDAVTTLALEMAYEAANGPKPDYSLNGKSYSWMAYKTAMAAFIKELNVLVQQEQPYFIASRGKS